MRLVLLTLLGGLSLAAAAQQYTPFPTGDAVWIQRAGHGDTTASYYCYGQKGGDTVLGTQTYHRLYRSTDSVFTASEFIGGLRETSKRVYYYNAGTSTESLLYDFNMAVGDTVKGITITPGAGAVVGAIDSMLVGSSYRRQFRIRSFSGAGLQTLSAWVEGIGNTQLGSLLFTTTVQPTCDCATNVVCFGQGSQWSYHNPNYSATDCRTALGVAPLPAVLTAPVVVPNPAVGAAQLRLPAGHRFQTVQVYNAAGAVVQSTPLNNETAVTLNGAGWPAGLYIGRLVDVQGRTATVRFVVP